MTERQILFLYIVWQIPTVTKNELVDYLGISKKTIERELVAMPYLDHSKRYSWEINWKDVPFPQEEILKYAKSKGKADVSMYSGHFERMQQHYEEMQQKIVDQLREDPYQRQEDIGVTLGVSQATIGRIFKMMPYVTYEPAVPSYKWKIDEENLPAYITKTEKKEGEGTYYAEYEPKVYEILKNEPYLSLLSIGQKIGIKRQAVKYIVHHSERFTRVGCRQNGRWAILENGQPVSPVDRHGEEYRKLKELLEKNPDARIPDICEELGISRETLRRRLDEFGLARVGCRKYGRWILLEKDTAYPQDKAKASNKQKASGNSL